MEARTVNNLPPAAPHDDAVRCLLAIELSKKSWIVAVNTPLSDKISRYTLEACDWKALLDLCERIRTRVAREMKKPVEIISCYEAGYDGFWLHRLLEAHGIRNYVIDPASLQVDRRARRAKTDGVDVERMLRSLLAYLRGEPKVWSVVRVPSVAEEDDRRLHRERDRLINERIQHGNRIKGLLAIHGIYEYQPLRRDRMQRLEQLRTADDQTLPPRLKAEILRELQRLVLVIGMIKTIEAERDAIASAKAEENARRCAQDQQTRGSAVPRAGGQARRKRSDHRSRGKSPSSLCSTIGPSDTRRQAEDLHAMRRGAGTTRDGRAPGAKHLRSCLSPRSKIVCDNALR
jgi:transposase